MKYLEFYFGVLNIQIVSSLTTAVFPNASKKIFFKGARVWKSLEKEEEEKKISLNLFEILNNLNVRFRKKKYWKV